MKLFSFKYVAYAKATADRKGCVFSFNGLLWASTSKDIEDSVRRRVANEVANPDSADLDINQVDIPLLLKQGAQYACLEMKWAIINFFSRKA